MTEHRLTLRTETAQKLNENLQLAVRLLQMNEEALAAYALQMAQENPALEYASPKRSPRELAVLLQSGFSRRRGRVDDDDSFPILNVPQTVSMEEQLKMQLRLTVSEEAVLAAGLRVIERLNAQGYFTDDLAVFAAEENIPLAQAKQALHAVQALEPCGVGARDLVECLTLQLDRRGERDELCYELARVHLLDIAKRGYTQIARQTGATLAHVKRCVEIVRSLTPKPCSLTAETVRYITPDFSVEKDENRALRLVFHNDFYPSLRCDPGFDALAAQLSGEERAYAQRMLHSAQQLIQAVELRQMTIEKVARIILREQEGFFLGESSLLPLRCDDVARELNVHLSTVYRALQGKYLYCSRGTFPLSTFFQRAYGGDVSKERVCELIRDLCAARPGDTDQAIADALQKRGVPLSRRTVAKYRAEMGISSSHTR